MRGYRPKKPIFAKDCRRKVRDRKNMSFFKSRRSFNVSNSDSPILNSFYLKTSMSRISKDVSGSGALREVSKILAVMPLISSNYRQFGK